MERSYRQLEQIARVRARNFYYAFVLLPADRRRALCAVYAFMRHCDDISDSDSSDDEKREKLQCWRRQLEGALRGECQSHPMFPAFFDSVTRFAIPGSYFHWILDGVEMDLAVRKYETFADLYRYCFNVAGSVGLTCLQIFGCRDERARRHAEECGIAFQLTNILRDVKEDASMGRIYLPLEDLRRFGYSAEELVQGVLDDRFRDLMTFQARRARDYYNRARNLLSMVDKVSRPGLWAMMEIYGRLLDKIVRAKYEVFGPVVRLSTSEKCLIAIKALAGRFLPLGAGRIGDTQKPGGPDAADRSGDKRRTGDFPDGTGSRPESGPSGDPPL
ncbi:MAG: phytoene/squalene synthase family protein [Acidobacteria bacterium]|nr:phytoene/squalene synthase family protein [Acidobacteriota bacterium]